MRSDPTQRITIDHLLETYVRNERYQGNYLEGEKADALDKLVRALPEAEIKTLAELARERYVRVSQHRENLVAGVQRQEYREAVRLASEELQRSTSEGREARDEVMDKPDRIQRRREYQKDQIALLTTATQRHQALWERLASHVTYAAMRRVQVATRSQVQHLDHLLNDLAETAAAIVSAYLTEGLQPLNDSIFPVRDPRHPLEDLADRQLHAQVLQFGLSIAKFRRLFGD